MSSPVPPQALQRQVLTAVFVTIFLDLVGFGMLIPVMPLIARAFGASDAEAVSLASVYSIGTLLAVSVLGRLSDKLGRRKILLLTLIISTFAQILTGLANSLVVLTVVRLIAGMASGNIAVAQACIADITRPKERGKSMALIGMAFGLGFSLGPALGALISFLLPDSSLLGIACVAATLNLANVYLVLRRFPETHHRFLDPRLRNFVSSLRQEQEQDPLTHRSREASHWWGDLRELFRDRSYRIVMVMSFLQVFGFVGVEAILSLMLQDSFHIVDRRWQYLAFMFIGIVLIMVNGGVSRPLLGKWGEVKTLNLGQLCLAFAMLGLPLVAPHPSGLYPLLALLATGSALANPSLSSLSSRLAPSHMQGFALGTVQTIGALARIAGPAVFGGLYQALQGPRSLFLSAGLMILGYFLALLGLRDVGKKIKWEPASS